MTFYDNVDWHVDGAKQAHQPKKNAFSHIGLYLAWLARHDMTSDDLIRRDWVDAIKTGKMSGSDLAGAVDGSLASDMMTPEGTAFTDYYYQSYLDDYAAAFSEVGNYGVADNPENYARIAPVLDERYRDWVAQGRPRASSSDQAQSSDGYVSADDLAATFAQVRSILAGSGVSVTLSGPPITTPNQEMEALARSAWPESPTDLGSQRADRWGDPLLDRALKRLKVSPKSATVTSAMWALNPNKMGGQATMLVVLYAVPGAANDRLQDEFETVIHSPEGATWESTEVSGKDLRIARGEEFAVVYWAGDGIVYTVAGPESHLDEFVNRLP